MKRKLVWYNLVYRYNSYVEMEVNSFAANTRGLDFILVRTEQKSHLLWNIMWSLFKQ